MIDLNECRKKLSEFMAQDPAARFSMDTAIHRLCEWVYQSAKKDFADGIDFVRMDQEPFPKVYREHQYEDREDGLDHCLCCGGAEGSMPGTCPGYKLPEEVLEAIYAGYIDYNNGKWWICLKPKEPVPLTNRLVVDAFIALGRAGK